MNFKFGNLLGAPYRGGNLLLASDTDLLSPVGNRVSITDLATSESHTLPCENSANVARIAVHPRNPSLLLSVDEQGRCLLIHSRRRIVLHRISFKGPVSALRFSPDGSLFAVAVGRLVQLWCTPGFRKEFAPFHLLKTFARCHDTVTCLDWTPDGRWIAAGSKDLVTRIFSVKRLPDYRPVTLTGHRDILAGVFFIPNKGGGGGIEGLHTVSRDGAIFTWKFHAPEAKQATVTENEQEKEPSDDANNLPDSDISDEEPESTSKKQEGDSVTDKKRKRSKKDTGSEDQQQSELSDEDVKDGVIDIRPSLDTDSQPVGPSVDSKKDPRLTGSVRLDQGRWQLLKKDFFLQNAKLTACDYHLSLNLVVAGFSSGIFGLYQMPDFTCIHLLSISREKISTVAFNGTGNWLAFGCAKLGQLLVWEWRSESYILKQQGHYFDVNCVAYSPDSQFIATGADDNKLKVWNASSGFCFVTFAEHTHAVTAVCFPPGNKVLLSASLDGTVRAWDTLRYRNFRTFTTPEPTQFASLAVDQSGEVICAGSFDSFQIYIWSMKTARLLDILSGHEGPVLGLSFSPVHEILASSSWDKTVRLWDVFDGKGGVETFTHTHDVLTVTYRPDGRQIACTTLDGQIHLWDPIEGQLVGTIEGRRDIAGGRLMNDRRTASNSSSGKCFTTICYSADGSYLLAGGSSKYICMYDVAEQVLLRRFQITNNRSLDGVLDFLNSKNMTDAGPLDLIDDDDSDVEEGVDNQSRKQLGFGLPGTNSNSGRAIIKTKCLQISPTGRSWVAATTEGVLLYTMDDELVFDPTDLDIDVTPEAVMSALENHEYLRALILSLRLNESSFIKRCIESVPPSDISSVVAGIPACYLGKMLQGLAEYLETSPHLEFILSWIQEILRGHGKAIQSRYKDLLPCLKYLQKAATRIHEDLASCCSTNLYYLEYLCLSSDQQSLSNVKIINA